MTYSLIHTSDLAMADTVVENFATYEDAAKRAIAIVHSYRPDISADGIFEHLKRAYLQYRHQSRILIHHFND